MSEFEWGVQTRETMCCCPGLLVNVAAVLQAPHEHVSSAIARYQYAKSSTDIQGGREQERARESALVLANLLWSYAAARRCPVLTQVMLLSGCTVESLSRLEAGFANRVLVASSLHRNQINY